MKNNYDVIIAGSGTGGAISAISAAQKGLSVLVIDSKKKNEIGKKVCGDAIPKKYFTFLRDKLDLDPLADDHVGSYIKYNEMIGPNMIHSITMEDHGYTLDRHAFGQFLVSSFEDENIDLMDFNTIRSPVMEKGTVTGLKVINRKNKQTSTINGDYIIDATGVSALLRSKVSFLGMPQQLPKEDYGICYREILKLNTPLENIDTLKIIFNQHLAAGGYIWIFPKSETIVNVGIGIAMLPGHTNPKIIYDNWKKTQTYLQDATILSGGGGVVPMRRPVHSLVGNGFLLVGDSGCQVNPMHGGGLGYSMEAGYMAIDNIIKARENGETSLESLWSYNYDWMNIIGARQAGLELFKILLLSMTNDNLNYGLSGKLINEDDILRVNKTGNIQFSFIEKLIKLFQARNNIPLLLNIHKAGKHMKVVKKMFERYPTVEEFNQWDEEVNTLFNNAKKQFPSRKKS